MKKTSGKPERKIWIYYGIIAVCVAAIAVSAAILLQSNAEYREGDNTYGGR